VNAETFKCPVHEEEAVEPELADDKQPALVSIIRILLISSYTKQTISTAAQNPDSLPRQSKKH
jgi:hypothetical protein